MSTELDQLVNEARAAFAQATQPAALENEKARYLGKNGAITERLKSLAKLAPEEKRAVGASINAAKEAIEGCSRSAGRRWLNCDSTSSLLPNRSTCHCLAAAAAQGAIHPVARTWMRIEEIFRSIGFDFAEGPEIETDWYNFTALNSPENHPARSMQDTFYVDAQDRDGRPLVLRTHTSPMQVRYARMHQPPIKVIAIGRCYRVDSDATHSPMFHQVEGLWLDDNISFADLKAVYTNFLRCFFETDELAVRFRPSYFPFTEPSAEIDMMFTSGPRKGRWLEISGCGAGAPGRRPQFRFRPRKDDRLCLWLGPRAAGDAALWGR